MRASNKEELLELLEKVKDRLSEVVEFIFTEPTKSDVEELIEEIKDTLYWA